MSTIPKYPEYPRPEFLDISYFTSYIFVSARFKTGKRSRLLGYLAASLVASHPEEGTLNRKGNMQGLK